MGRKSILDGGRRSGGYVNVSHHDAMWSAEMARHVARLEAQMPPEWVEPVVGPRGGVDPRRTRWLDVAITAACLVALRRNRTLLEILREWEQLDTVEIHDADDDDHLGGAA